MMSALLALTVIMTGTASQYAPGVMDSVIAVRQAGLTSADLPQHISGYDGYVAMLNCRLIGSTVYIRPVSSDGISSDVFERFLVTDCAGPDAVNWMLRNNIIAELDYRTAKRYRTIGRGIKIELAVMRRRRRYECQ